MFMFETLKLVPGGEVLGIGYEAIPILLFGLAGVALLLVPFLDRGVVRNGRSPLFTAAGIAALVFITGMTAWGYRSWVPVGVVAATAVFVVLMSFAVDVDREFASSLKKLLRGDRTTPR